MDAAVSGSDAGWGLASTKAGACNIHFRGVAQVARGSSVAVDAARAVPVSVSLRKVVPGEAQAGHVEAAGAGVAQQQRGGFWMVHLRQDHLVRRGKRDTSMACVTIPGP